MSKKKIIIIFGIAALVCIVASTLFIFIVKKEDETTEPSLSDPRKGFSLTIDRPCIYKINSNNQKFSKEPNDSIIKLSDSNEKLENLTLNNSDGRITKYILVNEKNNAFLDSEYFASDGEIIDVNEVVRRSESQIFAKIKKEKIKPAEYSQLIRDLVEGSVIRTFIHTNSVICFYNEKLENDEYSVEIEVIHYYYTNRSNEEKYNSKIVVDKEGYIIVN